MLVLYFRTMSNEIFKTLTDTIKNRRTVKPDKMNGRLIADDTIHALLQLADWAPTHGNTEPWRFVVYSGEAVQRFCTQHADLYKQNTPAENYLQANFDKLLHMGDKTSHIIIAITQRGQLPKIPFWEELAATSCAVQNILLGAQALGLASYWGSGGMATHDAMKTFLGLRPEDMVTGILYLGYTDSQPAGRRIVPLENKMDWLGLLRVFYIIYFIHNSVQKCGPSFLPLLFF